MSHHIIPEELIQPTWPGDKYMTVRVAFDWNHSRRSANRGW